MRWQRWILSGALAVGASAMAPALPWQPPATSEANWNEGVEVLARGPVHEAFATTTEQPVPGPVQSKRPPDPVEELPPDQKPDGDNVVFIPGYWYYDEDRSDYIWISGFWRATPPSRVWVPGSWREVRGGWQYVSGFWQVSAPPTANPAADQELEFLPQPPAPLEVGPSVSAPDETSFYVSGSWLWRGRYVWRPGFWLNHRPGWIWTPDHYRWTPAGYIYVPGYWDYPLATRGVLFAPVYIRPTLIRPAFVYTPYYAINEPCLYGAMFTRRGWGCYYFGDYFDARYSTVGFNAWCGTYRGSNFAISVGFGRGAGFGYDPLWDYYRFHHRANPVWINNVNTVYAGRFANTVARPPVTLVQQNTVINNITNVTNNNTTIINNNNKTVNNNNNNSVNNLAMLTSLKTVNQTNKEIVLKPVNKDQLQTEQRVAKDLREVAAQRNRLETNLVNRGAVVTKPTDTVQAIKLDVPKTVVARAQIPQDAKKAPPPPATQLRSETKPIPTTPGQPKVDPKPTTPVQPKKTDPVPSTPVQPKGETPKVEPKQMVPVQPRRTDPVPSTPVQPKVETPKVDPKPMVPVQPRRTDPVPSTPVQPKVEVPVQPKPVTPSPTPAPVVPKTMTPAPVVPKTVTPAPTPAPVVPRTVTPAPAPAPVAPKTVSPAPTPTPAPAAPAQPSNPGRGRPRGDRGGM